MRFIVILLGWKFAKKKAEFIWSTSVYPRQSLASVTIVWRIRMGNLVFFWPLILGYNPISKRGCQHKHNNRNNMQSHISGFFSKRPNPKQITDNHEYQ